MANNQDESWFAQHPVTRNTVTGVTTPVSPTLVPHSGTMEVATPQLRRPLEATPSARREKSPRVEARQSSIAWSTGEHGDELVQALVRWSPPLQGLCGVSDPQGAGTHSTSSTGSWEHIPNVVRGSIALHDISLADRAPHEAASPAAGSRPCEGCQLPGEYILHVMILGHQAGRDGRPTVKRFFCAFCYRDALARVVQTQQMTPNLAEQWYLIDVNSGTHIHEISCDS